MEITIKGNPKEIADLVLAVQSRQACQCLRTENRRIRRVRPRQEPLQFKGSHDLPLQRERQSTAERDFER